MRAISSGPDKWRSLGLLLLVLQGEHTNEDEIFAGQPTLCTPPCGGVARSLLSLSGWHQSMTSLSTHTEEVFCAGNGRPSVAS